MAATAEFDGMRALPLTEAATVFGDAGHADKAALLPRARTYIAAADPERAAPWHAVSAQLLAARGRFADAAREADLADRAWSQLPGKPLGVATRVAKAHAQLAVARQDAPAIDAARERWQREAGLAQDGAEARWLHCAAQLAQRRWSGAEAACRATSDDAQREPITAAKLQGGLGLSQLRQGRPSDAAATLRAALQTASRVLDPDRSPVVLQLRTALGEALLDGGDKAGARSQLEAARAIAGRHRELGPQYRTGLETLGVRLRR